MMKQELISERMYYRLRTRGAQPAFLYGLSKVHKIDTPLRPVLSIPGNSYHILNKFLPPTLKKIPRSNRETSTHDARKELELIVLDDNEPIVSLDIKRFHTNMPVSEAIGIALICLHSSDHAPDIERSTS